MTRRRFALHVDEAPAPPDLDVIRARLVAFNEELSGRPLNQRKFAVWLKDGDGAIVGGLVGITYWDWLYVDELWLDEGLRRRGWGTKLLARAERVARDRGCRGVWLDTLEFQAPGFYRKLGFTQFGELPELASAGRQWFWKPLRAARRRR